jgi:hypothetical protein
MTGQQQCECPPQRAQESGRLRRERRTLSSMIEIYCQGQHHPSGGLCPDCGKLLEYAMKRLDKCPYQERKPTCAKCPIHCYKADMREEVRRVMRYSGPRMALAHPFLTLHHYADEFWHSARSRWSARAASGK